MSGSLSLLPSLFATAAQSSTVSLLGTAFGFGGPVDGLTGQTPVEALTAAELNQTTDVKQTAAQPQVAHAIAAFTKGVQSAKSVTALLANPAVMQVLLTANGLGDQVAYTALATKALTSDLTNPNSVANTLPDTRWKTTAATYQFAAQGLSIIQKPSVIATLANAYAEVTWRNSLDQTTPGLSNALTFRAEASSITSVDQILGDSVMRTVVTGALGLPEQIAFQSLTAQEQAVSSRLNIKQFQDPKFVESFVQRYLLNANPTPVSSAGLLV